MSRISSFLYESDYQQTIRTDIRQAIENYDEQKRYQAEASAIEEMKGYLRTRYDVTKLFFDINPYDHFADYFQGDHIYTNELHYVAVVDVPEQTAVIVEEEMPQPLYSSVTAYALNDLVTYQGETYQADGVTTGNPPTDEDYWTLIDPQSWYQIDERNPILVMYACDISLYHLHSRISPHKIPDLRFERYEKAIEWLMNVRKGNINLDLTLYVDSLAEVEEVTEPTDDNNSYIFYGSRSEARNNYW